MQSTTNLTNSLQALYQSAKPLIIAENIPLSRLEPGQRIQTTIQEQVNPGLYKVQIAGQTFQLQLPATLKRGDSVQLQVVTNTPKLTFSFFASSNPIAPSEQLSSTSRFLSNLTELPLERTLIQSSADHPVWPATGGEIDSKQLASSLKEALGNSGLFYESHQAQWVRGERSTAQLLVEPQNKLQITTDSPVKSASPNSLQITTDNTSPVVAQQTDATPVKTSHDIPKEIVSMVQQQLHTLETHQLTWRGEVWPGQQMQWEIQGEPEHHAPRPEERKWSTEMELALPKLGDVHARLTFSQGGIKLALHAADANSAALFNQHQPALANTLADAGIPLSGSVIEKS